MSELYQHKIRNDCTLS